MPATVAANDPAALADFYHEHGYVLAKGVFTPEEMAACEREFDAVVEQLARSGDQINARWGGAIADRYSASDSVVLHTHNVQCYSAAWLRMMLDARFLDRVEALLGPDIVLHHTKLFQKPAERGAAFAPHQDWMYFPTVNGTMLAGILHVSEATDEMGCLRVFPGSHKHGRIAASTGYDADFAERFPFEDSVPVEAEPGDIAFFSAFTVHCSRPNRSTTTRKTVLVQLHAGDDHVEDDNRHCNARLVLRGRNRTMTRERAGR